MRYTLFPQVLASKEPALTIHTKVPQTRFFESSGHLGTWDRNKRGGAVLRPTLLRQLQAAKADTGGAGWTDFPCF